ncbi:hypothetical protein FH972_027255 [Carpinus fangiana]|uniref:Uncharacterized protein n=1 Tax=Carpinus fangiana TaxID=176857 RepID=A0A5N6L6R5_9ROSI|nr:hypothetical protein FH972_027255 [Carpinus fangiana]
MENLIHQLESSQPKELLNALNVIVGLCLPDHCTLINLGVLPKLAAALNDVQQQAGPEHVGILVQMAKAIGSLVWAFNFDLIGPFWHTLIPSSPIQMRRHAHKKYNFERAKDVDFVVGLMESNSESVRVLGATIVSEGCVDVHKRRVVCCEKVLRMLRDFLEGSPMKKDMAMEALHRIGWMKKGRAGAEIDEKFLRVIGKSMKEILDG